MPKFTFVCDHNDSIGSGPIINYETERIFIDDVLFDLTDFLRGCGFVFDGELQIVDSSKPDAWVADVGDKPTEDEKEWQGVAPSVAMQWTVNELMKPKSIYEDGYESPSTGVRT